MNRYARIAIALSLFAAAADIGLARAIRAAWAPSGPSIAQIMFLAGPLVFLALLSWRRRKHDAASRMLYRLAATATFLGFLVLGFDTIFFEFEPPEERTRHSHPLIVAGVQGVLVLTAWIVLVVREALEKQATHNNP